MSEIRVTSIVGENGGDRVGLTTGLTVGPLTGTTGIGATITHQGHAQFAGVCTATTFSGNFSGNVTTDKITPTGGLPSGSSGGIIQVRSVTKTDTYSPSSSTSFSDVPGLSVSITPNRSDSKILVFYDLCWGTSSGHVSMRLMRDSTLIKIGDASGSRTRATGHWHHGGANSQDQYDIVQHSGTFLDEPATTSAVTYKIQVGTPYSASYNVHVNRSGYDANDSWEGRTASTITLMEVTG